MLECSDLTVSVAGRDLVASLNLRVEPGEFVCVLGPNGVGKTLTLHTLSGLRPRQSGAVTIDDRDIAALPRREIATRLGLLLQTAEDPFPASVFETALCGRHPHIGFWSWESEDDRRHARAALEAMDLGEFADRGIDTLSGGERRRLAIATIVAQSPAVYLLDEPLNHLDPHHQLDVLRFFAHECERGRSVVMSLHDVNLAARFCHRALLLYGDGRWQAGPIDQVLHEDTVSDLFRTRMRTVDWSGGRLFVPE